MNYLPVAVRELRVSARKSSTFWLRIAAALTGLVVGACCMLLSSMGGTATTQMGGVLFSVLTWMCLAAGLCAGLFFTSDCLSEEKREGTLGLLFLTELRGYDVGLGKLVATSLRCFYGLLAILPILAVTLLMGGVTGAQFWKSSLALVNALFCSLAAGMFVSVLSRDSQKALAGTLFLLLLLSLGGPALDSVVAAWRRQSPHALWSISSPGYVLATASAWRGSGYWTSLAITELLGWLMFFLACVLVPRTWQEKKRASAGGSRPWVYAWKYGGTSRRARLRRKLLDLHPVAWLVCRERWQSLGAWSLAVLVLGAMTAALLFDVPNEAWMMLGPVAGLFTLVLYLWAASQSCRFLVDARRSGMVELLLATPLDEKQIIRGQWRGLRKLFGLPVLLLIGAYVTGTTLSQLSYYRMFSGLGTTTSTVVTTPSGTYTNKTVVVRGGVQVSGRGTNAVSSPSSLPALNATRWMVVAGLAAAASALGTVGNLLALGWFGMWMGMTSRSANLATLKTLLFVEVIPWFVITFASTFGMGIIMASAAFRSTAASSGFGNTWFAWWPLLRLAAGTTMTLLKDVAFISLSRWKLYLVLP